MMTIQSLDELERQVAVAEMRAKTIEAAYRIDRETLLEIETLSRSIERARLVLRADTNGASTTDIHLENLDRRMQVVLAKVHRVGGDRAASVGSASTGGDRRRDRA